MFNLGKSLPLLGSQVRGGGRSLPEKIFRSQLQTSFPWREEGKGKDKNNARSWVGLGRVFLNVVQRDERSRGGGASEEKENPGAKGGGGGGFSDKYAVDSGSLLLFSQSSGSIKFRI